MALTAYFVLVLKLKSHFELQPLFGRVASRPLSSRCGAAATSSKSHDRARSCTSSVVMTCIMTLARLLMLVIVLMGSQATVSGADPPAAFAAPTGDQNQAAIASATPRPIGTTSVLASASDRHEADQLLDADAASAFTGELQLFARPLPKSAVTSTSCHPLLTGSTPCHTCLH